MAESRDEIRLSEELVEERSFDELAKGLATGALCRRKALKLMGASIFGSMIVGLVPDAADAKKKKKKKKKKRRKKKRREGKRRGVPPLAQEEQYTARQVLVASVVTLTYHSAVR